MKRATKAVWLALIVPGAVAAQEANPAHGDHEATLAAETTPAPTLLDLAEPSPVEQRADEAVAGTTSPTDAVPSGGTSSGNGPADESGPSVPTSDETPPGGASYGTRDKLVLYEIPERFESPKKYTLSLMGGLTRFDELDGIMASSNGVQDYFTYAPSFRLQLGRQFIDQFQLQLELGFARYRGFALAEDGTVSGDVIEAKAYPASLSLSYRFDYFDEQAVVPYVAGGLTGVVGTFADFEDAVASSDDTSSTDEDTSDTSSDTSADSSSESTAVTLGSIGTRLGAYLGVGLEFLLDVFEPERASDLELTSGINDSYLVFDVRYYWLDRYLEDATLKQDQDNTLYNGLQVTAGLKFDF